MNRTLFGILRCAAGLALLPLASPAASTNAEPAAETPPPAKRRPNVILILADNLGYGDLGVYGQAKIKTPNLDQLAAQGIRFTSFYAGSPDDTPARAALFTGLEPRHDRGGFNQALAPDAVTLAAFLQERGFYTGLIGEWGLGDTGAATPDKKGFNDFLGFLNPAHAQDYYTDRLWSHDAHADINGEDIIYANADGRRGRYIPDLLTTAALNFIAQNHPSLENRQRSFFLCVAYPIPHLATATDPGAYVSESWPAAAKLRASMITRMDEGIGQIVKRVAQLKLDTNTVIIFTSVNGPQKDEGLDPKFFSSAGPWRGSQGSVYEAGVRVPMIVRWPARVKAGQVSDFAWAAWDLLPTVAEIASAKPPEKIDGISVLPLLTGRKQSKEHETFYWESASQRAVRRGDWKLVRDDTNSPALYNLKSDPGETRDVAKENTATVRKLEKFLEP